MYDEDVAVFLDAVKHAVEPRFDVLRYHKLPWNKKYGEVPETLFKNARFSSPKCYVGAIFHRKGCEKTQWLECSLGSSTTTDKNVFLATVCVLVYDPEKAIININYRTTMNELANTIDLYLSI